MPVPESHVGVLRRLHRDGGTYSMAGADAYALAMVRSLESRGLVEIDGDTFKITERGIRLLADPAQHRPGRPSKRHEDTLYFASLAGERALSDASWDGENDQAKRQAFNVAAAKRLQSADPRRKVTTESARSELAYHGIHGPEIATPDRIGDYLRMVARTARTPAAMIEGWRAVIDPMLNQHDHARRKVAQRMVVGALVHLRDTLKTGESAALTLRVDSDKLPMLNEAFAVFESKLPPA